MIRVFGELAFAVILTAFIPFVPFWKGVLPLFAAVLVLLFFARQCLGIRLMRVFLLFFGIATLATPLIAFYAPDQSFAQTSPGHPLGLDRLGRDLFSRLLYGNRNSLFIALTGSLVACGIGFLIGGLMAMGPKRLRDGSASVVQSLLSIPILLYYLLGLAFMESGFQSLILLFGMTLWLEPARLVQARVTELKETDFIKAARMSGLGEWRILTTEIMPNLRPVLLVNFLVTAVNAVLLESILSYLGLGLPLGTPSLGGLVEYGVRQMDRNPWVLTVALFVLSGWLFGLRTLLRDLGSHRPLRIQ